MLGCRAHRAARLFRLAVVKYRLRSSFPTPSYRAWHIQGIFWLMVVKCCGARNLAISIPLPRYGSALKGYTFIVCHSVSKRGELGRKNMVCSETTRSASHTGMRQDGTMQAPRGTAILAVPGPLPHVWQGQRRQGQLTGTRPITRTIQHLCEEHGTLASETAIP